MVVSIRIVSSAGRSCESPSLCIRLEIAVHKLCLSCIIAALDKLIYVTWSNTQVSQIIFSLKQLFGAKSSKFWCWRFSE